MKQEVKELWVKALRSGEYTQGYGYLKTKKNDFCCLGVLCDLYRGETGDGSWIENGRNFEFFVGQDNGNEDHTCTPTDEVIKWAGLNSGDPLVGSKTAISMNDALRYTFEQIADEIEKHL